MPSIGQHSTTDTHSGPIIPVVTIGQILCLMSDAEKMSAQVRITLELYTMTIF